MRTRSKEIDSLLLHIYWVLGKGTLKVWGEEFERGTPREVFRQINEENGKAFKLIARKTDGLAADFYVHK